MCGWLDEEPRQIQQAQARLEQATGKPASRQTAHRIVKKKAYRWKRCRRRVNGPRDEAAFRAAHVRLSQLQHGHSQGIIDLFYFDQSGFTLTPCIPYAWQGRGKPLTLPSAASPRVNVLGFTSPTHQSHFQTVIGRVTSATVIAALDAFAAQTARAGKLRLVVLDNAPIHTSQAFQDRMVDWLRQGVGFHWLPPYSPELNLIEILWRKIKYEWLPQSLPQLQSPEIRTPKHPRTFWVKIPDNF
ncbi:MAG: IS630 family transposase [Candidatus Competibacteraceae bacterium]|nr:IS630 family transposase [Candidatus Competibacteraceae bacterium]